MEECFSELVYRKRRKNPDLHSATEKLIFQMLPPGEVQLEHRIGSHIADVAWIRERLVFEIQCSYIAPYEALKRVSDYRAMGYEVVWILHQKMFNKKRQSPLEYFLRECPCYYTNTTATTLGEIYDQYDEFKGRIRNFRSQPMAVDLAKPCRKQGFVTFSGDRFHRTEEIQALLKQRGLEKKKPPWILEKTLALYDSILMKLIESVNG